MKVKNMSNLQLYNIIKGRLVTQETTVSGWAHGYGVSFQYVRHVVLAPTVGAKGKALLVQLLDDVGLDGADYVSSL